MSRLVTEKLRKLLTDEDTRYIYADSTVNAFIAAQIKNLREDRKLSQEALADLIGTKQSGISRLERADYSSWKIETLRKLARAFGVRLRLSFEEFGSLPPEIGWFTKERLTPRKFEDDPIFKESLSLDEEIRQSKALHQQQPLFADLFDTVKINKTDAIDGPRTDADLTPPPSGSTNHPIAESPLGAQRQDDARLAGSTKSPLTIDSCPRFRRKNAKSERPRRIKRRA